jgi:hypothetical protein
MGRPEAKDALNQLSQLIGASFIKSLSAKVASLVCATLNTKEGKEAFRENWPKIVGAYFHALCNPK